MKNRRWLRLTGWLMALVMILTIYPIATIAEEESTTVSDMVSSPGMKKRPEEIDITDLVNIIYSDESGKIIKNDNLATMDPNKTNHMKITVSGLDENNAIGDSTQMAITLSNVKITAKSLRNFSSEVVSAALNESKLILTWKNEKQSSLDITFDVLPNLPTEYDLSGSYALITKTKVMVGASEINISNRDRVSSTKVDEKNGLFYPKSGERSVWTLKHVSGDYYTLYSENSHKYLEIVLPNHATLKSRNEEEAQKLLVQKTNDGYYTFRFGTNNLNNTGNNAANGFASYTAGNADNEKFRLCNPSDVVYTDVLIFSINDGTGDTDPKAITAEAGTEIILPNINATKNGQNFIGWADVKDILSKVSNANHTYHDVYLPGTSYTMKAGSNTLYAVYNSTNRDVRFGIRKDGVIVDEPNDNNVSNYIGHFTEKGILKEGHWVIDINATKPVNGYYVENDVTAALNWVPSAEKIAEALKAEGNVVFDPETQYIHYYVLKYAGGKWKMDGVIRNKANVEITYDANVPGTEKIKVKNLPGGYQVAPGTDIKIGADENSTDIKRPIRDGYFFAGWNTEKDGSGTYYSENNTVHMTGNLYLYAQWISESDTDLMIRIHSDWPKGKIGYVGASITLTAELTGFTDRIYTLQWQYTTDGENWTDVPDAHDITYTYTLDETTTHYTWRVVAEDIY